MKIRTAIIGVTGYAGQELLRILSGHPQVSISYLASRQLRGGVQPFHLEKAVKRADLFFLALPHGLSMELTPKILRGKKKRVIDLSADFRLSRPSFEKAYGIRHASPSFMEGAVYGLTEYARRSLRGSRLVANPGCYPTAVLLGILPLAQAGLLGASGFIADAKSGVSGAGRGLKEDLLFCEMNENFRAYKVNSHQHMPEIEEAIKNFSGQQAAVTFVPHLVPMNRGLYATLYIPLRRAETQKRLRAIFEKRYGKEPFIRILPEGKYPQVRSVTGTNVCEISVGLDTAKNCAVVLSAIDNLGKGAAGQAVHNMNLMYGFEETLGLR